MSLIHKTFEELFNAIADAIREKENSSNEIIADNFPARIRGLSASGSGTNTFDATATANDIALGASAYVQGIKIDGAIPIVTNMQPNATSGNYMASSVSSNQVQINFNYTNPSRMIIEAGAPIRLGAILPEFGTVQPADVIKDQTFTSTAGLKKTGTFTLDSEMSEQESLIQQIQDALIGKSVGGEGITLPTLSNPGTANDLEQDKQFIDGDGNIVTGSVMSIGAYSGSANSIEHDTASKTLSLFTTTGSIKYILQPQSRLKIATDLSGLGTATAADVKQGKTFTSIDGFLTEGTALIPGGVTYFPDGAFTPVTNFTNGKQYALVALIDGAYRYINTTTYNNYTMNATTTTISTATDDYVIFSTTPVMFTAVASGSGFLLKNGDNYLHGTTNNGTALRVGTTQAVWTIDTSATAGFADGKYYAKEDPNQVWLKNTNGGYDWYIKYETAGSFGYDRVGRDNTYSTGFVSFILLENTAGTEIADPVVDTSDGTAKAEDIAKNKIAYSQGKRIVGTAEKSQPTVGVGSHSGSGYYISENAEGTLKPVTVPSNCFTISGVVNITESSLGEQISLHNLYLDTGLNLADTVSFSIPFLQYINGFASVYGFRDNEGWTIYYYGVYSSGGMTVMMRSDEMLMITNSDRVQYQGNMFTTSFVDSGKIPLLPLSTLSSQSSTTTVLDGTAFIGDYINYNGIPCGPDVIITYKE